MSCSNSDHTLVWSPFSKGGVAKCYTCEPPQKGQARRIGLRSNGGILTQEDIRDQIYRARCKAAVQQLGPEWEIVTGRPSVTAPRPRLMMVGDGSGEPIHSSPPSPQIIMAPDSPFWASQAIERASIAEYEIWAAKQRSSTTGQSGASQDIVLQSSKPAGGASRRVSK